jgi:caa(3)-type oxidase subunit IV
MAHNSSESHDSAGSHADAGSHAPHGGETLATLYAVYFLLMVLLVVTVAMAYYLDSIHASTLSTFCAMFIAIVKASFVVLIFMHVRHSSKLTGIYVVAAFFWLAILLVYSAVDYVGRLEDPNHNLVQRSVVAVVHVPGEASESSMVESPMAGANGADNSPGNVSPGNVAGNVAGNGNNGSSTPPATGDATPATVPGQ